MWNVVRLQSNVLSPAAEAFRYFMIEHGEAYLLALESPTTRCCLAAPNQRWSVLATGSLASLQQMS